MLPIPHLHSLVSKGFLALQRVSITAQQYEEHIDYLKGELTRAISQLNGSRAEIEEYKDILRKIEAKNATLESELAAFFQEVAKRPPEHTSSSSRPR